MTVEGQENIRIYKLIDDLFTLLNKENWSYEYVFLELKLLKFIGFDLNIKDYFKHEIADNYKRYYIENSQKKMIVPNFLIEDHRANKISNKDIYNSLTLISEYLKKNIFKNTIASAILLSTGVKRDWSKPNAEAGTQVPQ